MASERIRPNGGSTSPVHLHVADDASVHLHHHVKKRSDIVKVQKEREHGWIPPPAKSSNRSRFNVGEAAPGAPRAIQEISTEEEDDVRVQMKEYENRVDDLITQVGSLKSEVAMERSLRTESEEKSKLESDNNSLLRKIVAVELDANSAIKVAESFRDISKRFREERKLCGSDWNLLNKQRDLLVHKLNDFQSGASILIGLLHEKHDGEAATQRLLEQREILLLKISKAEEALKRQEETLQEVYRNAEAQKDENLVLSSAHTSLETTRAHLQKALRNKEADCNRLAVQVRSLESDLATSRLDLEHITNTLSTSREKFSKDKELLKKAARVQKEKANKSEHGLKNVTSQLSRRDVEISELRSENDSLRKEKLLLDAQVVRLNETHIDFERLEQNERNTRMDCERLRENLVHAERLVDEYKDQMKKARVEADDALRRLEEEQRLTAKLQTTCDQAVNEVRSRVEQRLQQLEPVPELLKSTELKLVDVSQKLSVAEKKEGELKSKLHQTSQYRQIQNDIHDTELTNFERRISDLELRNKELQSSLAQRDETVQRIQLKLDERSREITSLSKQLETSVSETRRITEQYRQKFGGKERATSARICDLEAELSASRAEIVRIKRERDESERKMNSKLYDLKERLEQSVMTNRSMQNYVSFLKTSYANTFGEGLMNMNVPQTF